MSEPLGGNRLTAGDLRTTTEALPDGSASISIGEPGAAHEEGDRHDCEDPERTPGVPRLGMPEGADAVTITSTPVRALETGREGLEATRRKR